MGAEFPAVSRRDEDEAVARMEEEKHQGKLQLEECQQHNKHLKETLETWQQGFGAVGALHACHSNLLHVNLFEGVPKRQINPELQC